MKPGQSVRIYRVPDKPPVVVADEAEAKALGVQGRWTVVPLAVAMAVSVREHHDWKEKARSLARLFVAEETGQTRKKFAVDYPAPETKKIPMSVTKPPEFGGGEARVICAHDGRCICDVKHTTRWMDIEGGLMVTVCSETKKVYWIERADPLAEA